MPNNLESKSIEQLLAEADEIIQKVNSDAVKDMKEEQRLQVEKHAQNLKKIKSEVHSKIKNKERSMERPAKRSLCQRGQIQERSLEI